VMAQSDDGALAASVVDEICEAILAVAHASQVIEMPAESAVYAAE